MEEDSGHKLSKIPFPEAGTDEAFARGLIEMVLNATLNRYLGALEDAGYKRPNSLKQAGWVDGKPSQLLQMKFDIMDEAIEIFSPEIVKELKNRESLRSSRK